jgi:hypothetical protein
MSMPVGWLQESMTPLRQQDSGHPCGAASWGMTGLGPDQDPWMPCHQVSVFQLCTPAQAMQQCTPGLAVNARTNAPEAESVNRAARHLAGELREMSPPRQRKLLPSGSERKFSWATQRIADLTAELEAARAFGKVCSWLYRSPCLQRPWVAWCNQQGYAAACPIGPLCWGR